MIRPFTVRIPQDLLEDLKKQISITSWPDEPVENGWEYGASLPYMQALADYWLHRFDWRKTESYINAYPNFIAEVEGQQVHFVHVKGKAPNSFPLIITHGWPGSFLEMLPLIPLLTEDPAFSFDLVIPSIPGFGFSKPIQTPGGNYQRIARLWAGLMQQLGYTQYGAQGGDLGAAITIALAMQQPQRVKGIHLNYIPGSYQPYIDEKEKLGAEEEAYLKQVQAWTRAEGAYAHVHATKPLTLAYALNDSPMGLCAWIVEKFNSWSDNNGTIENSFTKEQLMANVTLYWVTRSIYSSMRIYQENSKVPLHFNREAFVQTPVAIARFAKEINFPPRSYVQRSFNIQRWTEFAAGGHFAAMEQPATLCTDITRFFKSLL